MPLTKLNRRTVLRGLVGGAAVSIALPPLEAFVNSSGTAYADGTPFPKRFGIFFWGNGVIPSRWAPTGEGANWQLSEELTPLAAHKADINVLTGFKVNAKNDRPHGSGPAGLLTGSGLVNDVYVGPTVDQVLARELGGDTRFRSLEFGVQRSTRSISYASPTQMNPIETSPAALFNRLFGDDFRAPGDSSGPDPRLALRRSVLDGVIAQTTALKARLGSSDKARLDQHLEGVRSLERQIERLQSSPVNLAACARPGSPLPDYPDIAGRQQLSAISHAMSDLVAMALACDQTRFFFDMFTQPLTDILIGTSAAGHHQLTHDEAGDQPQVNGILVTIMQEFAYLLEALKRIPEGSGTLLDNCVVLGTTDCGFGRTHQLTDYPLIVAGKAGGALKTGLHVKSTTDENASKLMLTIVNAIGLRRADYGLNEAKTTERLLAIEAT